MLFLVPPARSDKTDVRLELANAAAHDGVNKVYLLSSAVCDYANATVSANILRVYPNLDCLW